MKLIQRVWKYQLHAPSVRVWFRGFRKILWQTQKEPLVSFLPGSSFSSYLILILLLIYHWSSHRMVAEWVSYPRISLCVYFHFWEPQATWRKIRNTRAHSPGCVLGFFIKHHFESQTQTQVSYFTLRAGCCHFLPLRLLWRGSVTLASELATGADAHNPVDTCRWVMKTSHLSLKTKQWNFAFGQVPCCYGQPSASPSYGKVRDMEGRSGCLTSKMRWNSLSSLGSWHPVPHLIHRRHRRN